MKTKNLLTGETEADPEMIKVSKNGLCSTLTDSKVFVVGLFDRWCNNVFGLAPLCPQRAESHGPVEIISHWHPNLTINMVDDHTAWVKGSVPPPLDQRKPHHACMPLLPTHTVAPLLPGLWTHTCYFHVHSYYSKDNKQHH